jgi:hypothetical protein
MDDAVQAVRARALAPSVAARGPAPYLAAGLHVGFLLVCVSAAITSQPADFPKRAWGAPVLVGLALVIAFFATRGRSAIVTWGRLLVALGIGLALGLAYDPQLKALPGLASIEDSALGPYNLGLANVGSLLVLIFWIALAATGAERPLWPAPLRNAAFVACGLIAVTAIGMYLYLGQLYDLEGPFQTVDLLQKSAQYTVLIGAALGLSGAGRVRGWPQLYVGLALLAAFARNIPLILAGLQAAGGGPA